jgi:hypothetical protein
MLLLLSEAGRSFLRAFVGSVIVLAPGILSAPNLDGAKTLAVAALFAAVAAGLKAVQVFIPQLSFRTVFRGQVAPYYVYADSFVRAFLGAFIVSVVGLLTASEFSVSRSLLIGVVVGAVVAGVRAVQGILTPGDVPAPQTGLNVPPPPGPRP